MSTRTAFRGWWPDNTGCGFKPVAPRPDEKGHCSPILNWGAEKASLCPAARINAHLCLPAIRQHSGSVASIWVETAGSANGALITLSNRMASRRRTVPLYLRGVRQRTSLRCRIYHAATISGWSQPIGIGTFLPVIRIAERIGKCSYFCFGVCCWFSPGLWR